MTNLNTVPLQDDVSEEEIQRLLEEVDGHMKSEDFQDRYHAITYLKTVFAYRLNERNSKVERAKFR